ncbi:MAG TPA: hypothetical protein VE981_06620 [Planctomycetota bacterium]|nr:hypothetical protein [Planctomycetota bacterium]
MRVLAFVILLGAVPPEDPPARPRMGEFMGINGHTVQFKPDLYSKVCRKARDYHPLEWDLGKDSDFKTTFPEARNRVNWNDVYGSWQKKGFETNVSIMESGFKVEQWKDIPRDARAYGVAFAKAFGPTSGSKVVTSAEIFNEPGKYPDDKYREVFENMAKGLREGDPRLKIATCNIIVGKSGGYEKSVDCVKGLESLYDILNIHTYSLAKMWPSWRRSYPEDTTVNFVKPVTDLIAWRDQNAKGKEIWITEFGWDASTKPNKTTGDEAKWEGNVSDEKQAQYLVRSYLVFSALAVDRAYMYFFNDEDEPSFHAASGVTRHFQPKPSFHAMAHLYRSLGEYRLQKVVTSKPGELFAYEYVHGADAKKKMLVAWSPTGADRKATAELPLGKGKLVRAERMPLTEGDVAPVDVPVKAGIASVALDESPLYLWLQE